MSPLLKGEGLALVRGGRLLFEDLDLKLERGEALHVTGPNGSGKSSLIRLVAGLLRPNAGRIERAEAALADEGAGARPRAAAGPRAGLLEGPSAGRGDDRLRSSTSWRMSRFGCCRPARPSGRGWRGSWPAVRRCGCSTSR